VTTYADIAMLDGTRMYSAQDDDCPSRSSLPATLTVSSAVVRFLLKKVDSAAVGSYSENLELKGGIQVI